MDYLIYRNTGKSNNEKWGEERNDRAPKSIQMLLWEVLSYSLGTALTEMTARLITASVVTDAERWKTDTIYCVRY